jgi:hypothetical protein
VEAALTAALAAVGLPLAAVATAVFACRLVSFWAVVAGGWVASNSADTAYSADRSRPDTTPAKASRHHPDHGPGYRG